ncbi:YihD family protein [Pantoea sp. B9002]|uniref:YihD family protein n=1 Tax=Pantoea sp. B9002 TaxID=2726979 RepID=UPI0015A08EF5|nr:YihD family protein [Pantoea sp. B9002]NWA61590.1 YihD family protein [Pantoea sp. B9002]
MKYHRLNELIELLQPAWQKDAELNLLAFLQKLAQESGFSGPLSELTDDVLIYHLKMRDTDSQSVIPGLKKDYEVDFKTALLRARGVIKDDE